MMQDAMRYLFDAAFDNPNELAGLLNVAAILVVFGAGALSGAIIGYMGGWNGCIRAYEKAAAAK